MIDIDDKYISSTAYHECGHIVVAAVQEMPLRNLGVRMDSLGCGKTFHWHREPDGSRNNVGPDRERERTIVTTSAGYIAQKRFYGDALTNEIKMYMEQGASGDTSLVIELSEEMYSGNKETWFAARASLFEKSSQLVDEHWSAIDGLAKALLARPWEPRNLATDVDGHWSIDNKEKWLHGIEVVAILEGFGVSSFIVDDSVGTYSPT